MTDKINETAKDDFSIIHPDMIDEEIFRGRDAVMTRLNVKGSNNRGPIPHVMACGYWIKITKVTAIEMVNSSPENLVALDVTYKWSGQRCLYISSTKD